MSTIAWPRKVLICAGLFLALGCLFAVVDVTAQIETISPELLREASRRTGLSEEELLRRYAEAQQERADSGLAPGTIDSTYSAEPGRTDLRGIDDRIPGGAQAEVGRGESEYWRDQPEVFLSMQNQLVDPMSSAQIDSVLRLLAAQTDSIPFFGASFFKLDAGVFSPPSFGPVPEDYVVGIGDEIVIDVWGEVELRVARIVDRDGAIILPKVGKIPVQNRRLDEVKETIREKLASVHSGISLEPGEGDIFIDVSLGILRGIRIFVVGETVQPGSYELSSVATVFTALYAAGGPTSNGSMRDVRLVRDNEVIASLDVYDYLLGGRRLGDSLLRDGDTVFIPSRGPAVRVEGEVERPIYFEIRPGEGITDVLRFAGGFTPRAATEVVHVHRILPPEERRPTLPDRVLVDIPLDPRTGAPLDAELGLLLDGDILTVTAIEERLENWIEIKGNVKRPGIYQFYEGLDVTELINRAGGLWSDTLEERALIDRTDKRLVYSSFSFALGDVLRGEAEAVLLQPMDVVHIFSLWDVQDRYAVTISGEVRNPLSVDFREGMTLRDLVLKAGGLLPSADPMRAEVARLKLEAVESMDIGTPPRETVQIIEVPLGRDFLTSEDSFLLRAHDRVVLRKLPWWEMQRTVRLSGEVFFPGDYSLERQDEKLSSIIARAGGLKPSAYPVGARVIRQEDQIGNIAVDLIRALEEPGSTYDIIMMDRDQIIVPEWQYTVKVTGEVGFPTSLVWEQGKSIDYYVERAGGYLENADQKKSRVVHPNGLSLPNRGGSKVIAGSTVIVPLKPPPEGPSTLQTLKEITLILGSLATVWLAIDRSTN